MQIVSLLDMLTSAVAPDDDAGLRPQIEGTTHHRKLLLSHVPPTFLRDFIRALLWAYRHADEVCKEHLDEPEAHDTTGIFRRALIEGAIRAQAIRHGGSARALPTEPGTSYYSRVQFGSLRLTECAVDIAGKPRRPADFREEMAAQSQQALAFIKRPQQGEAAASFYAIIYHGFVTDARKRKGPDFNVRQPDFLGISFPNRDCSGSLAIIDLTAQLRHEIESAKTADVEHVGELNLEFTAKTGTKIDEEGVA
jgi:hypothetical protein